MRERVKEWEGIQKQAGYKSKNDIPAKTKILIGHTGQKTG